ncbi:MAG TPA: hypothetical protein VKA63_05520 [Candidatus Krumholzibacteria bacterium]|nr:hypothetical protein [Candidatus Krumholzibacteria bacterium]
MKRQKIGQGDRNQVRVSARERELLADHTFTGPEYVERLLAEPGGTGYAGMFTLDDLEDILGFVAAEANHCEDRKLQRELDTFYDRLSEIEQSYDDGGWSDSDVSRTS